MPVKDSDVSLTTSSEWIECTLADACSAINYGLTAAASSCSDGPKFLRITDIVSGQVNWKSVPHVEADKDTLKKYRLHDGDIVIARTGASTGASAYLVNPPESVFASYLVRLKARPEFDARFIAYFLKSNQFTDYIDGALGDKSAQPNASASTMTAASFRAPKDKSGQRAIAHVLGTLDDKIELNQLVNETLEAMARALFKSWFVDFDPVRAKMEWRWRRGESLPCLPADLYDLFPERLVDSELGEIPEGWEVEALGEVASVSSGKRPGRRQSVADEKTHAPLWGGNGPMGFVDSPLIDSPFLLTGRVGTLGSVFRITIPSWPSDNTLVVIPKSSELFESIFFQMERFDFDSLNRGSSQPLLTQADLKAQLVVSPANELIGRFHAFTKGLFQVIDARNNESRVLAALRDVVLPRLVSGKSKT